MEIPGSKGVAGNWSVRDNLGEKTLSSLSQSTQRVTDFFLSLSQSTQRVTGFFLSLSSRESIAVNTTSEKDHLSLTI